MRGKVITGATAVLILAFFFLPWFAVSYNGRTLGQFSGYQLAAGAGDYALDGLNGRSPLYLVPVSAIVVLLLIAIVNYRPSWRMFGTLGQFVAAGSGMVVLIWHFWEGWTTNALTISVELGFVLTAVCFVMLLARAILDFRTVLQTNSAVADNASPQDPSQSDDQKTLAKAITAVTPITPISPIETGIVSNKKSTRSLYKIGAAGDDPSIQALFVVVEGANSGEKFRVMPPMRIGRDGGNDIIIDDSSMSGYHAVVREEGGVFHIQDLNSTNGIYLENQTSHIWQRVPATTLVDDMRIKLGRTVFQVVIEA